jgi:serine phosphatase RsbU (regulator of sigma subunit)
LGAFEDIRMEEQRIDVAPGDVLVFYTDGVTDAMDERGELFEEARLREVILSSAAGSAAEVRQAIADALTTFTGDTEQADDVTCVVVKRG